MTSYYILRSVHEQYNCRSLTVTTPIINGDDKCRVQRGYSWRLSRPSLRRSKKQRTGSDSDAVVLNNGRDHIACNGKLV